MSPRAGCYGLVILALLLAGLSGVFDTCLYAIDPHRAMSQYVYTRWGPEQGFPAQSVLAITQTADGYLWVGTEGGLLRFDGTQFLPIRSRPGSAQLDGVIGLAPTADGSLWVRLRNRTLLRYRKGELENPLPASQRVPFLNAMVLDKQGELIAAIEQNGVYRYVGENLKLSTRATGIPRSPVLSLSQTLDGNFWLGTRGAGLFRLGHETTTPVWSGLPDPKVNCLMPDGAAGLWIGTDRGLTFWNGTALIDPGLAILKTFQILTLAKDRDGNLWVGTDTGKVFRVHEGEISVMNLDGAGGGNAITAIFEDREGSIWIGSADGLRRVRDSSFVTYSVPEGLPIEGANPILVDASDRMWFAPASGGLWGWEASGHGQVAETALSNSVIYSIAAGEDCLWLGLQRGGLARLSLTKSASRIRTFRKADGLSQNNVYAVYVTRAGAVWAGTVSGGASQLQGGKFVTYTMADGLASNTITSLVESSEGTIWFGTPNGLSSLTKNIWHSFKSQDGLPSDDINCILEDSAGVMWTGTAEGLAYRGLSRFRAPGRQFPSLRESVMGIAEDRFGWLWLTTSHHVLRVNRHHLLSDQLVEGDIIEFGLPDGLRGTEGVKRNRSVVTDRSGRIWMSLKQGISVVDPARLRADINLALPVVQSVSVDGVGVEMRSETKVPSGSHRVDFDFAGLSLSIPERVRFRYRLDGFDNGWSSPVSERRATYTNLGPGPYTFRVIASSPQGLWSAHEGSFRFAVPPASWQTWWFRLGALLACGLAIVAVYRMRLQKLTAELNVRFEERLAERTRIAQELHDTLLQGFISAAMQVHVAADGLPASSNAKSILTRALDLMRQVTEEGRNAVRGLRSKPGASINLEDAFTRICTDAVPGGTQNEDVEFSVKCKGACLPLHPLLSEEVYRIGREAIINAYRHAHATRVEVELTYLSNVLRLVITDNGCGIAPQILLAGRDGHWGLSGMRERADRVGGKLRLRSSAISGTEVELTIPGSIAFRNPARESPGVN